MRTVFEGTPKEMDTALNTTLSALPDDTVVYCGHEYTKANVAFSSSVDPDNEAIKKLKSFCESNEVTTGKFTIGDEKAHNVRCAGVLYSFHGVTHLTGLYASGIRCGEEEDFYINGDRGYG